MIHCSSDKDNVFRNDRTQQAVTGESQTSEQRDRVDELTVYFKPQGIVGKTNQDSFGEFDVVYVSLDGSVVVFNLLLGINVSYTSHLPPVCTFILIRLSTACLLQQRPQQLKT